MQLNGGRSGGACRGRILVVCLLLAAATVAAFGPALRNGFVNYDDDVYVYGNPWVSAGLTLHGIRWAFTQGHGGNWHPLTWISHMLDCQVYGLKPWGHHLTNILLHAASVIVLFLALRGMTGALFPSAFVAALFAVHPLRVESVAWVAERKDVLSGLFFMLTLAAYLRYVRHPGSVARYLAVCFLFAPGLLSKPTLVTVPFVLLLLDVWPLGRFKSESIRRLALEKVPLFALSAAACIVTLLVQRGSTQPVEQLSLSMRLGNVLVSYVTYLRQMFWPVNLAVLYPFPENGPPLSEVIEAFLLLAAISAAFFLWRRKRPYLLVGWLWYLGMLVPVIGLVQVGAQAHADRYTYLPQIGIYLLFTWTVVDLCPPRYRWTLFGFGAGILYALILCSRFQTAYWRDGQSLWTRALDCTERNGVAENNLGNLFIEKGQVDEAMYRYRKAIEFQPRYYIAFNNLGNALARKRMLREAAASYVKAIEIEPRYAEAHYNFGNDLYQMGAMNAAIAQFQEAIRLRTDYAEALANLGSALLRVGRTDLAISAYKRALALRPADAGIRKNLGIALSAQERSK